MSPIKNSKIGVLLELSSHKLDSQEKDSKIKIQLLVWKWKIHNIFYNSIYFVE